MSTEKEEVTPWFTGSVRPVYVGYYERDYETCTYIDWWGGVNWYPNQDAWFPCRNQDTPWCGRSTPPANPANGKESK